MASIIDIEGLKGQYAAALRSMGICTSDDLLEYGSSQRGRRELSKVTGLADRRIQEWVRRADLLRVPGIEVWDSNLLEAAGVETVRQLRRCRPIKLHAAITSINSERHLVAEVPGLAQVKAWVTAAHDLPVVMR